MNFSFITGMGRSGTKFISSLIALDKNVISYHEHFGNREYWLASWYLGNMYSVQFLKKQKLNTLSSLNNENIPNETMLVDSNSYLQDSIDAVNLVFESPKIFHLVRDPRKVIPSLINRRSDRRMHKIPKNEIGISNWLGMNKLEQVCTNWAETTQELLNSSAETIKFEKCINDYSYVDKVLFKPLGLKIDKNKYNLLKSKKINKTRGKLYRYLYAKLKGKHFINTNIKFSDLKNDELEIFYDICGKVMNDLNY